MLPFTRYMQAKTAGSWGNMAITHLPNMLPGAAVGAGLGALTAGEGNRWRGAGYGAGLGAAGGALGSLAGSRIGGRLPNSKIDEEIRKVLPKDYAADPVKFKEFRQNVLETKPGFEDQLIQSAMSGDPKQLKTFNNIYANEITGAQVGGLAGGAAGGLTGGLIAHRNRDSRD